METADLVTYCFIFLIGITCLYTLYRFVNGISVITIDLFLSIYDSILSLIAGAFRRAENKVAARYEEEAAMLDEIYSERKQNQAVKLKEDIDRLLKAEEADQAKLAMQLASLKSNLPFHTSKKTPSAELADHDKRMWDDVTKLVKEQESKKATLYFVKIKSLLDDNEYFKIGITTVGVKARFQQSTQVELLETVCSFDTELWKAAYLEYHFLREFRLYDGLASALGELRPEVGFSGYTEVVRSNSVKKISEFFGQLDVYNELRTTTEFPDQDLVKGLI
jgi:hypothetical protein